MLLVKWRRILIIVGLFAIVASWIFSGPTFIKPKFKSTVILFPTTTNSISKALLSANPGEKSDILEFGVEEQAEQMLQILNSDDIRNNVIKKFDLMKHYRIDLGDKYPFTAMYREYQSNITFERTEFMSVKIEVMDEDAQMAADIANNIASELDSIKTKIQRERAMEGLRIVERTYKEKEHAVTIMEDSLKSLAGRGIFDYKTQAAILNEEYTKASSVFFNEKASLPVLLQYKPENDTGVVSTKARIAGAEAKMKELSTRLDNLAKYGGDNIALFENLTLEREVLSKLRVQYLNAKVDAENNIPGKFVVNSGDKAEKKSYPVRWLIVVLSTLSSLFFAFVAIIGFESYIKLKRG